MGQIRRLESASITAEEALDKKVIDFIAADLPDLLKQLDGREINGKALNTANATVVEIPMNACEKFSQLFLRPEVMFILMLMVIYGIMGELSSPGAILPGVVGVIALILVLYMSAILPVNITGIVLIGLAIALFVTDVFAHDAWRVDGRRHRGVFSRFADAVQQRRAGLSVCRCAGLFRRQC